MGSRGQGFRKCRRLAINKLVHHIGKRKLDLWICVDVLLGGLICKGRMDFIFVERVQQCLLMNYLQQSTVE